MLKLFQKFRTLSILFTLTLVVGGSFIFSLIYSFNKITLLRSSISTEKDQAQLLNKRLSSLKNSKQDLETYNLQQILQLLPNTNSGILASSQINYFALTNNLLIENFSLNSVQAIDDQTINKIIINFEVSGDYLSILNFINDLKSATPLLVLDNEEVTVSTNRASAEVSITSFWAKLPEALPSLTSPITTLTTDELEMLAQLGSYSYPQSPTNNLEPKQYNDNRLNPFSYDNLEDIQSEEQNQ